VLNLFNSQKLSFNKIKFSKGKSLFVIIPIALMVAIIVIAASTATNLINVAHSSIFSPIASQNEIIELNKSDSQNMRQIFENEGASTGYTSTDNSLVYAVDNVEKVSLLQELPIATIKTPDLFDGKTVRITGLAGLAPEYASLYTASSFIYTENVPIPIILNANDFYTVYEDWQGKTEISVDFSQSGPMNGLGTGQNPGAGIESAVSNIAAQNPIKTSAIQYNRNDLLGKTITINFGGLDDISDIKQESTETGYKYVQKTTEEINTESTTRQTAISKYWDYTKISTPISFKFIVVGISEGTDKTKAYIPENFASKLLQEYLTNETLARSGTAIASSEQNATYLGLVFDGVSIQNDSTSTIYANIRNQVSNQVSSQISDVNQQIDTQNQQIANSNAQNSNIYRQFRNQLDSASAELNRPPGGERGAGGGFHVFSLPSMNTISSVSKLSADSVKITYPGQAVTYTIPGLVYSKNRTSNEITGEYTAFDFTKTLPLQSTTMLIKITSVNEREAVVAGLNAKGFRYQDYSQYKQYEKLESSLNTILTLGSIIFMVVTALFILINMAKFVSEGRKEIGIFRAIGATKGDIRLLFMTQSFQYIVLSIIGGVVFGMLAVLASSGLMATQAKSFINSAVGSSVIINSTLTNVDFMGFDLKTILLYSAILIVVTLIVALIPSSQAAKVSPVEAIRN